VAAVATELLATIACLKVEDASAHGQHAGFVVASLATSTDEERHMRDSTLLICAAFALVAGPATAAPENRNVAAGTELNAALVTSLDSGRVQPGDEVTARITQNVKSADGAVVIPKGATLVGRVTQARQHGAGGSGTGGASAELGMIFDRAVTNDGKTIAVDATIVALAAERPKLERKDPVVRATTETGVASTVHHTGSGALETVGGVVSGPETTAGRTTTNIGPETGSMIDRSPGAVGGIASNGRLISGSRGVFAIADLAIAPATSADSKTTVLTSPRKTVELEAGTQLLLVASEAAPSETQN
jgi:hypothetical protein